jgi:integrase
VKLTNTSLKAALRKPGRHGDGDGLYLRVLDNGTAIWVYRYSRHGQQREMAFGRYPELSLAAARERHRELRRRVLNDGADPARDTYQGAGVPTFGEAADAYLAAHESGWRNDKHRYQWRRALTESCQPIRETPVNDIDTAAVLSVLRPLWLTVPETAVRTRGRIEVVLDAARALGHIDENRANPARWRGHLDHLLPKRGRLTRGHHAALPYADCPAFMAKLSPVDGMAAKALRFTILTTARTGEVLGMQWSEVNMDQKLWVCPAERMKMGKDHAVPLSDAALNILQVQLAARRGKQPYVFPGSRDGQPLSNMSMMMAMRRLRMGAYTVHGFRSSFRDWAAEYGVDDSVAEQCLAHQIGTEVTRAYFRTTQLDRRRLVLTEWAMFLTGESAGATVVPFTATARR